MVLPRREEKNEICNPKSVETDDLLLLKIVSLENKYNRAGSSSKMHQMGE